jgi:hypothetical protein
MNTRGPSLTEIYTHPREIHHADIDFDDSHIHWMKNKRKLTNGLYRYICTGMFRNGSQCNRNPLLGNNTCRIHTSIVPNDDGVIVNLFKPKPTQQKGPEPGEIVVKTKPTTHIHQVAKQVIHTLRKNTSPKTFPIDHVLPVDYVLPVFEKGVVKFNDTVIDLEKETIQVLTVTGMRASFRELMDALKKYGNIGRLRTPKMVATNQFKIYKIVYHLQLVISFMEGLNEMTKLETKRESVVQLKECILTFMEYDPSKHLHTTTGKWLEISRNMQDDIAYVIDDLMDGIDA